MPDSCHPEKSKNVVSVDIINSLLKTGNKKVNINVKNLQFISGRELTFTFAICHNPSVCRLSVVCDVGAPYSGG